MARMAVAVKKLDVSLGDVVEIDGRRYDVVSDYRAAPAKLARWLRPFGVEIPPPFAQGRERAVSRSRADAARPVGASARRGSVKRKVQ